MNLLKKDSLLSSVLTFFIIAFAGSGASGLFAGDLEGLINKLKAEDPRERVVAVRELAKSDTVSAIPPLEEARKDYDTNVRAEAISAIKEVCLNIFLRNLSEMLDDPESAVKDDIINSLASMDISHLRARDYLIELAKDTDSSIRSRAIAAMREARDNYFYPILKESLRDEYPQARISAIYSLVKFGNKSDAPLIAQLIFDVDHEVQEAAIDALAILRNEDVLPTLSQLCSHKEEKMRSALARCIGRIGSKEGIPILSQMLSDPSIMVKISAINALSRIEIRDISSIPMIAEFLDDKNKDLRRNAVKALKALDTPIVIPELLKGTQDSDALNRSAALIAISELHEGEELSEEISSAIDTLSGDPDKRVRQSVALAIANMDDHSHLEILTLLIKDPEPNVRLMTIKTLGELKEKRALPHLLQAYEDKNASIRLEVIKALKKIGDPSTLPIIKEAAVNDEIMIRKVALAALGEFIDQESEAILWEALNDPMDEIRLEAELALQKLEQSKKKKK